MTDVTIIGSKKPPQQFKTPVPQGISGKDNTMIESGNLRAGGNLLNVKGSAIGKKKPPLAGNKPRAPAATKKVTVVKTKNRPAKNVQRKPMKARK